MKNDLRIRIELNKGRVGIPLKKLAGVADEAEKFLKMVCEDSDIDITKGQWIARDFQNSSVIFTNEYIGEVEDIQRESCNKIFEKIMASPVEEINGDIRRKTLMQYTSITNSLDSDEVVTFGLYKNGDNAPSNTYDLSRQKALKMAEFIEDRLEYHGAIQGIIHELNKGTERPYFKIRELSTKNLIKCFFPVILYDKIIDLLRKRDGVVHISGLITASRIEQKIESMKIEYDNEIKLAEEYMPGDLEKFQGCASDILGEDTLQDVMSRIRGREH